MSAPLRGLQTNPFRRRIEERALLPQQAQPAVEPQSALPVKSCTGDHFRDFEETALAVVSRHKQTWHLWPKTDQDQEVHQHLLFARCLSRIDWQRREAETCSQTPLARAYASVAVGQGRYDDAIKLLLAIPVKDIGDKAALFDAFMRRANPTDVDVAHSIFENGHADALEQTLQVWPGHGPLTLYAQTTLIKQYGACINTLMAFLAHIQLPQASRELTCLAVLEHVLGPRIRPTHDAICQQPTFSCATCCEDRPPQERVHIPGCTCKAEPFSQEYLRPALERLEIERTRDRCPTGCGTFLERSTYEQAGLGPQELMQRLRRVVGQKLAKLPGWTPCSTLDCPAGCQTTAGAVVSFACPLCASTRTIDRSSSDPAVLKGLLVGLAPSRSRNGNGLYRECASCGAPTEKGEACSHMTCTLCGADWDFVDGPHNLTNRSQHRIFGADGVSAQEYRPKRDGPLGRSHFYEGIPRGRLNLAQQHLVQFRAKAWLKRFI